MVTGGVAELVGSDCQTDGGVVESSESRLLITTRSQDAELSAWCWLPLSYRQSTEGSMKDDLRCVQVPW